MKGILCEAVMIIIIVYWYLGRFVLVTVVCYLPSETYGRNGATQIFRSVHRTASSTTGDWSRWTIFNMLFYIILSTTVSFLDLTRSSLFLHVHFACMLCI